MRRRIIFISVITLLCALLFSSGCIKQESARSSFETDLKVMTFNIRYGSADDGENSWPARKSLVFEVIRKNNPDLLGLQEALNFQINEILDELPGYSYIGVGRDNGKSKGEHTAILYVKDRFIVDTTETFWFSETPYVTGSITWEGSLPRICTWGLLYDKFCNTPLYVYNVHLDHQSQVSREKSAERIIQKIESGQKNVPIVLTGDFNCGENNPAIQKILSYGLIDSYRNLNAKNDFEGTFNGFMGDKTGDKIDYIFVNDNFKINESRIDYTKSNGKYPSDHFPVTAILNYK